MTTITDEPINLPQALAAEIARVSALRQDYLDLPRNAMLAALRDLQHFTH